MANTHEQQFNRKYWLPEYHQTDIQEFADDIRYPKPFIVSKRWLNSYQKRFTVKIEIENASEVVNAEITEDGRIYGLSKFAGKKAKVVVLED